MAACTDRAKELARIGEMSVAQLKEECRTCGVKVSGTKKELSDRLKAYSRSKAKTATKAAAAEQAEKQAATEKAAIEKVLAEKVAAEQAAAEKAAANEAAAEKAAVAVEKAWAEKVAAEHAVAERAAADKAAADKAAANEAAAEKAAVAIEKAWAEKVAAEQAAADKVAAEQAVAEKAAADLAAAEKAAANEAAAEKAAVAIEKAWAQKVAAEQAAAEKVAAEKAAAEKAAAELAAAEKASAETAAVEKVDSCVGGAPSADFAVTDPYTENKEEPSESHKGKDRSRSPRLAAALASLPTATRRRCTAIRSGGAPASTEERARSRSPIRKDVADQPFATPSKFGCMYDRLKAKADAKERGDNVSTDWTPRASPLRANWQTPTRTPTSSLTASNAAFLEQASSSTLGSVTAEFAELTSKPAASTAPAASPLGVPKMIYRQADLQADLAQLTIKPTAPAPAASPTKPIFTAPAAFTPKRSSVAEGRMRMLEGLTEQMKICLARLQDKSLDDKKVEQYQELAKSIRKQMDQITSARTPGKSPGATMRSPAFGFSPASWRGC